MMKLSPKEQLKLCGEAVIDFINAKTTDKACLSLIPKIKIMFDFSTGFEKEAKENFPYFNNILDHLNDIQRTIVELHFDMWTFNENAEDFFKSLTEKLIGYTELYDRKEDLLIFERLHKALFDIKKNQNYNKTEEILIYVNKIKPLLKNTPFHLENYVNELCEQLIAINKTKKLFRDYSKDISESEEVGIESVLNNEVFTTHHDIYHLQKTLGIIINRFIAYALHS